MVDASKIVRKNPLFFAFLSPALTDGLITLLGQSSQYWNGGKTVNEASPAYFFLLASPWVYSIGVILWFIFWYWVFKKIKEPFNLFLMFTFIAAHSWGSGGWIKKFISENGFYTIENQVRMFLGWGLIIAYFFLIAVSATYCLRIYLKEQR